ncbi:MAG: asparagine synthase C-terminal domain-containing protein [Thermoplasmata archaeon]
MPEEGVLLFSGGIDSSFLAFLAARERKDVTLFSVGTSNSHDFSWTKEAASILGLPLKFQDVGEKEVLSALKGIKDITGEGDALIILIELPLYFACIHSNEHWIISGQGSDELFLGYRKYDREDTSHLDLENVLGKVTVIERKIGLAFNREISYPYLGSEVISVANRIPRDLKVRDGHRKFILRQVALQLGLDERIAWKPKKASQYSSGLKELVEKIAKREGKKVHQLIRDL